MHFKVIILLSFFCYLVVGCTHVPNELKIAEHILDTAPDSALHILQHLKPEKYKSNSNHALYNLLLFKALDQVGKPLPLITLIDFSMTYYLTNNDKLHLAYCYFYKGHYYKCAQRFDEATESYIKALECIQNNNDYFLLANIYSDMGDVCSFQLNYKESLKKYKYSLYCYNQRHKSLESRFIILAIGRTYRSLKDYKTAKKYYRTAIYQVTDSMLCGSAYQEIGTNFYLVKQFDSAQYYLRKSLLYPFKGTNYSIRCYNLSDLLFDKKQYDSSSHFALIALEHPSSFYTQRECYRILVNVEYLRKDIKQMGIYMTHFQNCTDSIRIVESQTKSTVLESIHNNTVITNASKRRMIWIVSSLLLFTTLCICFIYFLYKRNKNNNIQLEVYKHHLNQKQKFVSQGLTKKIEETRAFQLDVRKNSSVEERAKLDIELYNNALHLNNWDDFNREMNHAFNNIVVILKLEYPAISHKEICWCCFHLLDIPHADKMLLLESTSDSLYKLKQRLSQKLNLKTTKDLDMFLKNITAIKD